jgi:hypothetical protein
MQTECLEKSARAAELDVNDVVGTRSHGTATLIRLHRALDARRRLQEKLTIERLVEGRRAPS